MKYLLIVTLTILFSTNQLSARDKVIYGVDNRIDIPLTSPLYPLVQATAGLISSNILSKVDSENYLITNPPTLQTAINLCSNEKFKNDIVLATCTGSLIAPNILVTAGHCVPSKTECPTAWWIFEYNNSAIKNNIIKSKNIFKCQRVLDRELNMHNGNDYAIIELDHAANHLVPLKYRKNGQIKNRQSIFVIGHPTGIPAKLAAGARVEGNDNPLFFYSNLDTFGGNSGSPVFNTKTKKLEGILVRGATDYIYNQEKNCMQVNRCNSIMRDGPLSDPAKCRGEDVTRITNLKLPQVIAEAQQEMEIFWNALINRATLEPFIQQNLSPNYQNPQNKKTTFDIVVEYDAPALLEELSQMRNFNINFKNNQGETILISAIKKRASKLTNFLLSLSTRLRREFASLDYSAQDNNGLRAIDYAKQQGDWALVEQLENHSP